MISLKREIILHAKFNFHVILKHFYFVLRAWKSKIKWIFVFSKEETKPNSWIDGTVNQVLETKYRLVQNCATP